MNTTASKSKGGETDFTEFWNNFQPLPLKWASHLVSRPRYLVGTVLFVYLLLAIMTLFPSLGSYRYKVLRDYPSITIIFLGWIMVITLTIRWWHKIPSIFQWLWESGRLGLQNANSKNEYRQFLQDYQKALLSKRGPLSNGISLAILFFLLTLAVGMPQFLHYFFTPAANVLFYAVLFTVLLWIFLVGLMSGLLVTTSKYIGKLTERFSVQIQPSHPDRCGGLKPLGDFCFSAAMPLIGGGLVLATIPILRLDIDDVLSLASTLLIFLVVGPLTVIAVFMPLWNIHNNMVEQKKAYADKFTGQIIALEKEILTSTSEQGDLVKAKAAKEKFEILQLLHPDKLSYPVWPFKFTITVIAIFSPQILQTAVGIVTSIYNAFFK